MALIRAPHNQQRILSTTWPQLPFLIHLKSLFTLFLAFIRPT